MIKYLSLAKYQLSSSNLHLLVLYQSKHPKNLDHLIAVAVLLANRLCGLLLEVLMPSLIEWHFEKEELEVLEVIPLDCLEHSAALDPDLGHY